jgi:hypothetical protein
MGISVKIIADSVGPSGKRLTSFELCYPRFIHSELMTHRALSRNASSSRAIPIEKMIKRVLDDPAIPTQWGGNQKGMQAAGEVDDPAGALKAWLEARDAAVHHARVLAGYGLHKQIVNRVLEPFQHMVTLVTATEWANFFHLRYHKDAQPEFQVLARQMYEAYVAAEPEELLAGEWHLPYVRPEDFEQVWADLGRSGGWVEKREVDAVLKKVSVGRCARVSYVNQYGVRALVDDIALYDRLMASADSGEPGHWSPMEHVAMALNDPMQRGNLVGWLQYRKEFPNENTTIMPKLGGRP